MATLYTHKSANIWKTFLLFSVFFIVIIAAGFVFSQIYGDSIILYAAVAFSCVMSFISYWYSDKIVLSMTHAVPITRESHPNIYNLVENLAITAGLPMPKVYLIPEVAPNAFATGRDANHAVVALTAGIIERLNKAELEGVIAHELSHIGNRDILVSTVAVVLAGFISILADFFFRSMFWGGRGRDSGRGGSPFAILGIVFAILAPIGATLLQLAISRKREYLADASGALLTRYPEGLASALEKISADPKPMRFANTATAHLWLADPMKNQKTGTSFIKELFMTHPPIKKRVQILREMSI